jgi:hypothetical protein
MKLYPSHTKALLAVARRLGIDPRQDAGAIAREIMARRDAWVPEDQRGIVSAVSVLNAIAEGKHVFLSPLKARKVAAVNRHGIPVHKGGDGGLERAAGGARR